MDETILKEINEKLNILVAVALKKENTETKIKLLCNLGLKSDGIGKLIGMTGRGVRKSKAYKE